MADVSRAEPERSTVAGILAGLAPLAAVLYAFATLVVLCGGMSGVVRRVEEAGIFGLLILLMLPVAGLTVAPVLFLVAWRGTRVPTAVVLGLAVGPWMLGLVGTFVGMTRVNAAIQYADLSSRSLMSMVGSAEAMAAVSFGAWGSGALLCASALGLAIAARARKAPDRTPLAALAAVPVLTAIVLPLLHAGEVENLFLAVPSGLVVLVAMGLAGSAVGRDGESGSEASAAGLACALGLIATLLALVGFALTRGLSSAGSSDPASRALFLSMGLRALVVGRTALFVIGGGAMLGASAVAALSFVRARPTPGRLASAVAAVLVALLAIGADRLMFSSIEGDVAAASLPPWHEVEGFEPTRADGDSGVQPHAVVTPERVIPFRGDPVSMSDGDALRALFVTLRAERNPMWHGDPGEIYEREEEPDPPEWLDAGEDPEPVGRDALDEIFDRSEHRLGLALDERLSSVALRHVITSLVAAEVDVVTLVSVEPEGFPEDARAQIAQAPMIEALTTGGVQSTSVMLEHVLPVGYADRDQTLWHGEVNGDLLQIQRRVDAPVEDDRIPAAGLEIRLDQRAYERRMTSLPSNDVVYLTLGAPVTPRLLFQAVHAVDELEARPVLVLGETPGHPERPAVAGDETDSSSPIPDGLSSDRFRRDSEARLRSPHTHAAREGTGRPIIARVHMGALAEESGAGIFDPAIVARSFRGSIHTLQSCCQQLLVDDPTLAGRVLVRFTIQPSGRISAVGALQNTTDSDQVAACAVAFVTRHRFRPGPEGGAVTFAYPFVLPPQQPFHRIR